MGLMVFLRKHKLFFGVLLFDLFIIIVLLIVFFVKNAKNALVDIVVVPEIATVKIGGNAYSNGVYKTFPGDYNVVISADGFEEKKVNIKLNKDETTKLYVYLKPKEDNINYYAKNFSWNDYKNLELINDEEASKVLNTLSIHDNLPIDYYERDDFGHVKKSITIREANDENCNSYFCLEALMALTDDKDLVKEIINNKGFKADNYDIKYKIY